MAYLDDIGLAYFWSKIKNLFITSADLPGVASDSSTGTVKTNSDSGISLNASGQLEVTGRLGQMSDTTGMYAPSTINPAAVGNGSLLVTEASNTSLGSKSMSVTTGFNITLASAASAGATTYNVTNNYANRILCTIALNGVACLNEANAANTVSITSIKIGNATVAPSSANSSGNIVITTASSVNPSASTSTIRVYPSQLGFSNLLFGAAGTGGNGYSIVGGQNVLNTSNASSVFGNTQYNTGNSSLLAGRQHINTKQNAFLAGYGHDTTNGTTEVAAVGKWSNITSNTAFAVGNGTSSTSRKNAFEVKTDGSIYANGQALGDGNVFIVNYNGSSADQTFANTYAAFQGGKIVSVYYGSKYYILRSATSTQLTFKSVGTDVIEGLTWTSDGTITASSNSYGPEIYWITFDKTNLTSDKTFAEINTAINAGKLPIVMAGGNHIFVFLYQGSSYIRFTRYVGSSGEAIRCNSDNTWGIDFSANLQEQITASGMLKGNGAGGVTAAVAGVDYQTPVNFSGVQFYSGSASIAEHNANNATKNGNYYYSSNGPSTAIGASTVDGGLYVASHSDTWLGQIAQDYRNGNLFVRGKNSGTWTAWKKVVSTTELNRTTGVAAHDGNYTTCMARGMSLHTADTNPSVNGAITWTYS